MPHLLWDASALTKRYAEEEGSETVDVLFAQSPPPPMAGTFLGYTETAATLWRKRNRGAISDTSFRASASALRTEFLLGSRFQLLTISDMDLVSAVVYVQRHNLNASDAAILVAFLRYAGSVNDMCVLVAADGRLVRAAIAEGLKALSPEQLTAADVPVFLAAL